MLVALAMASFTFTACDDDEVALSSDAMVSAFAVDGGTVTVDGTNIAVTVPFGTDVTNITPTFTLPAGATATPASGVAQDFSSPVTYTITAADGTVVTYTVTVTVTDAVVTTSVVWEKTAKNNNLPAYVNGSSRDIAAFGDYVYLAVNNDKIIVLNKTDGSLSGDTLDLSAKGAGTGNTLNMVAIDVDDNGTIVGSNTRGISDNLRLYKWANRMSDQEFILENADFSAVSNGRSGDNIDVIGDVNGNATIYMPAAGRPDIFRVNISAGIASSTPEKITLPGNIPFGASDLSNIDGTNTSDFLGARFVSPDNIVRFTQAGAITDSLRRAKITTNSLIFNSLNIKAFKINGKSFFAAVASNYASGGKTGTMFIVDYTNGLGSVTDANITAFPLTDGDTGSGNGNATGGVDVIVNGNEAIIYALGSNHGIGAYKLKVE